MTLHFRALRQALVGKALSASSNISLQNKCRSKFKKMLVSLLLDDVNQINMDDKETYFVVSGFLVVLVGFPNIL